MTNLWKVCLTLTLVFQDLCNSEILWNVLQTECKPHFISENVINISHSIYENTSVETIIYKLWSLDFARTTDLGNGSVFFKENFNPKFSVKNDTGYIIVNEAIDFESNPLEVVDIIAFDNNEGKITKIKFLINILDVDEPPSWTMPFQPYKAQLTDNLDKTIYQLSSVDPEHQFNPVSYGIFADEYNLFQVDSKTGEISLKVKPSPDILAKDFVRITVTVTERNNSEYRNAADIYFYTSRQPPQFTLERYTINIKEDVVVPAILTVVKAKSFQPDGSISYSIVRQPDDIEHSIDENGSITVMSNVDREYRTGYTILIKAVDSLGQGSITEILVLINDVNDNPPVFSHNVYTFIDVREDHNLAHPIGRLKISDPDFASNGTYYISCDTPSFRVADDGNVYSLENLDYENKKQHRFQVTATDLEGRFGCAYVLISVTNIPDERPVFSKPFYQFEVDRNASIGYNIGQVFANDPDGNEIKFNMKSITASQYFNLDQESGILSLASDANNLDESYTLIIVAKEINSVRQGLASASNTIGEVKITINVKDLNIHTPVFPYCSDYLSIQVFEEAMIGTFVLNITVVDPDRGRNGEVEFSLNNHGSQAFSIETQPGGIGILRTRKSLDRELQSKYTVTVIATDQAMNYPLRSTCTFDVLVLDINDNTPKFDYRTYSRTLDRNIEVGNTLLTIHAEDPDIGDSVRYSLTKLEGREYFELLSNGALKLRTKLTSLGTWKLEASATDSNNNFKTTQIVLEVVDSAHRLPIWNVYPSPYILVGEDIDRHYIIFDVKTTSYFNPVFITYEMVWGLTPQTNSERTFVINTRGEVVVDGPLDYEAVQFYQLKFRACDAASAPNCAYMTVIVNVTDVNDAQPRFLVDNNLSANIVEGDVTNKVVLQLQARDSDVTSLGVSYSIIYDPTSARPPFIAFRDIVETSAKEFDREEKAEYYMQIQAEDNTPQQAPDVRLLTINILDVNDNLPVFDNSSYTIIVREDTVVGTELITISATDVDNDKVEYLIIEVLTDRVDAMVYKHDIFHVDSGSIVLSSELDFETTQWYTMTYAATDGVHQVITSLVIQITDVNDKAPQFSQQVYEFSAVEGTLYSEETVLTIHATEDVDPFGSIIYSTYGEPAEIFSVDPVTGDLKINGQLDHEHKSEWRFLVIATDGDGAGVSSVADVVIYVQDINDNAPVFLSPQYIGQIYEGSPVGSFVTKIAATDDDIGQYSNLLYSLSTPQGDNLDGVNGADLFKMEPSGEISTLSILDRELHSTYFLEVTAMDIDSNTKGSCTVTVSILDKNDNKPKISQDVNTTEISERVDVGYRVANIYAHDADIYKNAELSFSIFGNEASSFLIDVNPVNKQSAVVRVKKSLDYQIKSIHNISVNVSQASYSKIIYLIVNLEDINDFTPSFSESSWKVSVMENTVIGTNLLNVTATDFDPGFNGVIRYSLSRPDELEGIFAIHPVNGGIYLKDELDREKKDSHKIQIIARDQGSPSLWASTTVHIKVIDVNDNSPLIRMEHDPVVPETAIPPYQVAKIKAMDLDAPHNQGPFTFEIMCADDPDVCHQFGLIDHHDNTSILETKTRLDSKVKSRYTIKILIKDSGEPQQSSINSFNVIIIPADSDSGIYIIIGTCAAVFVFLVIVGGCCCLCYKQRKRCSLRKSYDVAGHTQTYQSFTIGLRGGLLRVGTRPSATEVESHRRKLARRSLSESDHDGHAQNTFGMELNSLCFSDKLTTLGEENENIDRDYYHSDSSLDLVSSVSFSVESKTSKWVDESRARTLRQSEHEQMYSRPTPTFSFRTQHRVFTPTYV